MVAQVLKSSGGFVWATKNYDGDVQSEVIDVDGVMTKDSELAIYGKDGMRREHRVVTDAYIDAVKVRCLGSFSFRFVC